jgi:folate-binding protein YgfZ
MTAGTVTEPGYATIIVSGADAAEFLQGQLTADLKGMVDSADATLAAWCNPKGRVIALFRVRLEADRYRLALPADLAEPVVRRLTMFRFRSKVDFSVETATQSDLCIGAGEHEDAWAEQQFAAGIARIGPAQSEAFTPHMLNLDLLGAISFDKGCYTGQEIVARTHYRGATRRRMLRFAYSGTAAPGDKLMLGDRPVGEVVNVRGDEMLAVAPVEDPAAEFTVNDQALTRLELPYL